MKRFFSTIFRFIVLLVVLGILGVVFAPQTAVQFFGEKQQSAIKTSLGCDMPTLETEFDYNDKIDELNQKLDILIQEAKADTDTTPTENTNEPATTDDTVLEDNEEVILNQRKQAKETNQDEQAEPTKQPTEKTEDNKTE